MEGAPSTTPASTFTPQSYSQTIFSAVMDPGRDRWTHRVVSLQLPKCMDIVMGDVCGGSGSASMAREVLRWKDGLAVGHLEPGATQEAKRASALGLWQSLARLNGRIAPILDRLDVYRERHQVSAQSPLLGSFLPILYAPLTSPVNCCAPRVANCLALHPLSFPLSHFLSLTLFFFR